MFVVISWTLGERTIRINDAIIIEKVMKISSVFVGGEFFLLFSRKLQNFILFCIYDFIIFFINIKIEVFSLIGWKQQC